MPAFTVITATWNRSRHILPTIRSVLGQSCADFEYLVIGDCCTDDTESVVRAVADPRLRWLSTTERWRSQSGANNLGIAAAKGDYIAYLGHDDIWSPDNLAAHLAVLTSGDAPEFSVTGCIKYGSPGTGLRQVSGLFDPADLPDEFFFVPSSTAHRRDICARIGPWLRPDESTLAVDVAWFLAARKLGMRFVPTGRIGAHKFTAFSRYLSYMEPESWEQEDLLARMLRPDFAAETGAAIAAARDQGTFTPFGIYRGNETVPGVTAARTRAVRGVSEPVLTPLAASFTLRQNDEPRSQDWRSKGPDEQGFRTTGPSPAPRLLIPVTAKGEVSVEVNVRHRDPAVFGQLRFRLNGTEIAARIGRLTTGPRVSSTILHLQGTLRPDRASVLQIIQPRSAMSGEAPNLMRGIAVGDVILRRSGWAARTKAALGL